MTYSLAASLFDYYFTVLSYIVTCMLAFGITNIVLNLRLLEAKLKTTQHGTPLTDKELEDSVSPISVYFVTLYARICRLSVYYYLVRVGSAGKLCHV